MGAPDLLAHLRSLRLTVEVEAGELRVHPKSAITNEAREFIRCHKAELLSLPFTVEVEDSEAETRRRKVESMLANNQGIRYAVISDMNADPNDVLLTLAIRDLGTCELAIPKAKYDPFKVLRAIEEQSAGGA